RVAWRYHHVAAGDTLDSIARHYHTSPSAIREVNNLQSPDLQADSKIIIPITAGRAPDARTVAYSRKPTRYKVRRGDTVASVADDFGVPADRLRRWNHLKGERLPSGRMLVIYRPVVAQDNPVINNPSRHRSRRSGKHHSSASVKKASAHTSPQTKSSKASAAKTQSVNAATGASERAAAGLR